MTQTFKPGDKVRAVETNEGNHITKGEVYEVVNSRPSYFMKGVTMLSLKGIGDVFSFRFEKVEDRDFPLRNADELVNVKTGRKGFVLLGHVYDQNPPFGEPVPAKALDEYERHHPGTYEITYRKQAQPW